MGGKHGEFGISRGNLLCRRQISNKVLPYSTGNCIQSSGINHNGEEYKKRIYVYKLSHCTAHQRPAAAAAKSLQSCPTLCNPIDGSPPGSPIPGILQARTLEWVAISFSNA